MGKNLLNDQQHQEYAAKLTMMGVFLSIFTAFVSHLSFWRKGKKDTSISPFDLILLALSTFRLGRMVAYDKVADPLREPFTEVVQDESGAGKTIAARGEGVQRAVGELISCPICAGTWIAAALVYGLYSLPSPTRIFLAIMSTIGGAELLNSLHEALSWTGQAARHLSGDMDD